LGDARIGVLRPADVMPGMSVRRVEVQDVDGAGLAVVVVRVRVHERLCRRPPAS
jgi:hypothetical protein